MNAEPEDILNCYHAAKPDCSNTGFIVTLYIPYKVWDANDVHSEKKLKLWLWEHLRRVKI